MPSNVRDYELMLKVRADLQQAVGGLGQLSKSLRDLDKTGATGFKQIEASFGRIGNLASSLKGALSAAGVGIAFKTIIDNAIEAENNTRQLEQRLKSTGGAAGLSKEQLLGLADSLQSVTTFEDDAIVGAENLLLAFTNIKGPIFKQATEAVLNMSTALGQDLKTSAQQVGRALNDPVQGMTALSRAGVVFNDQQKKVIQQLVDTGHVADAQRIILGQLEVKWKDAARAAADTFGGALAQVKNAFGNLLEGDGGGLNDAKFALQDLRDVLQEDQIKRGFAALVEGAVRAVGVLAKLAGTVATLAKNTGEFFGYIATGGDASPLTTDDSLRTQLDNQIKVLQLIAQGNEPKANYAAKLRQQAREAGIDASGSIAGVATRLIPVLKQKLVDTFKPAVDDFVGSIIDATKVEQPAQNATGTGKGADDAAKRADAQAAAFKRLQDVINGLRGDVGGAAEKSWQDYAAAVQKAADAGGDAIRNGANVADVQKQVAEAVALAAQKRDETLRALSDQARQAYEQLRQELRTPAEAATETAQAQIKVLDDALRQGIIDAKTYRDEIARVGQNSVKQAPQYQGVDAAVAGVGGELAKNFEAQRALEEWHAQQLAANEAFRQQDTANEAVYQSRLAEIQRQYAEQRQKIEVSRQQLTLQASSDFFGQLAVLSRSNNSKIAAIGKVAAIAKATIDTYQSATAAYAALAGIPYIGPALGAAAAGAAIAAGLANVAQIRAQPTGFATGGSIRGPGTGTSDSILIRASNGEFMQSAAAVRYYGEDFMHAVNDLRFPAFADGGLIGSTEGLNGVRAPAQLGNTPATTPQVHNNFKFVTLFDREQAAQEIAGSSAFEKAVVHIVGENPTSIRARWGR